jgi:hypothetical protein
MILQQNPYPRLLGQVLQPNTHKLESCKFNVIINIINITLESDITTTSKTHGYSFAERFNIFKS